MRQAQQQLNRGQISRTLSIPSPVMGWNARDPVAEMKPTYAVILDNYFCTPYDVMVRYGYSNFVTGFAGNVNTIASYSPVSGGIKLFASCGASIYDASTLGAVGAAVVSGMTSDKYQHVNMGTAGGNFLLMVNGADKLVGFDGTTWWKDGDGTHDITGVDTATISNISVFGKKVWLIQRNTLKVWYLPTLSIGGAAQSIDFGSLFNRGGYLVAMLDWSLDGGYGMDDYAAFITSEGQVAIYRGYDPSSTTTWALVGQYDIGSPIGKRCMTKYAGDVTIICQDGLAPLSKSLMSSRVNSQEMLTDKIIHVISDYVSQYGSNFGWECCLFPKENMYLLNVPTSSTTSYQLVMNTISGAWSRWIGLNAMCFELHGDNLFFGGNGVVCKAWDTQADNGANINFEGQQAFNYFGSQGQLKQIKMVRPVISTDGAPSVLFGVNTDYDTSQPTGIATFTTSTSAIWDSSTWDSAIWGGDLKIKKDWQSAFGLGYSFAAHMVGSSKNLKMRWASTDYVIEPAGVI